ncbi:iron sulfur cluster assembly-related [Trichoderma arundinaceum]|uniref:Iron sulfur cluster assembly-related n=1 Tax=Trichoderma arundinaceum TaxID=490622 RepID=A0A395NU76_TRIAR|nr:iron sulfur cluster assembly-related [Trichoderma arundinaceum]
MIPLRCADGASAARSFVQLAKRRYSTTTAHVQQTPLEFLVPRGASRSSRLRATVTPSQFGHRISVTPVSKSSALSIGWQPTNRSFSASAARLATICVQNPLKDEDGKDMVLEITPRAAQRLSEIMVKDKNPNLALRIRVESGGCHGFQYLMSLITMPTGEAREASTIVSEEDSIFQYVPDEANSSPSEDSPKIILDEPSLELLKGSKVDFTKELIGSQFKIVDNPYATSSCGCGASFDIKM